MKTCEKNQENIYLLNTLPDDKKSLVLEHIKYCTDCRGLYEETIQIQKHLKTVKKDTHPKTQLIERFAVFTFCPDEPDYDGQRLSKSEIHSIKKHLTTCKLCSTKVENLQAELTEMDSYWQESEYPDFQMGQPSNVHRIIEYAGDIQKKVVDIVSGSGRNAGYRWIPLSIAATLLFFILSPYFLFNSNSSDIAQLAHLDDVNIQYSVRGNSQVLLQQGIKALNEKAYLEAVNHLENNIHQNPNDLNNGYTHYLCGLAMLMQVDKNSSAQTEKENRALIKNSLTHLQNSLSGDSNLSIREDVLWYMAKAHLMKNDIKEAKNYFQKTNVLKGRRFSKSRDILNSLEKY